MVGISLMTLITIFFIYCTFKDFQKKRFDLWWFPLSASLSSLAILSLLIWDYIKTITL